MYGVDPMRDPNAQIPRQLALLRIETNHGYALLSDVQLSTYVYNGHLCTSAVGTVAGGGVESRLFYLRKWREYPRGERLRFDLGQRHIRQETNRPDEWAVNLQFC